MISSGISFGGLASGLDTDSIVAQLVALRRAPIQRLQTQKTDLKQSLSVLNDLKAAIEKLGTAARKLDTRSEFISKNVVGENEEYVKLSATANAAIGAYDISISALAQSQRDISQGYASASDSVGTGSFTLTINGEDHVLDLEAGADSLSDLQFVINNSNLGVTASLVNTGIGATPFKLVLTHEDTGASNSFSVDLSGLSGGTTPLLTNDRAASNASFNVNGIDIESESNTTSDAISGITIQLIKQTPNGGADSVSLNISSDPEAMADRLQEFVDAYNGVVTILNTQSKQGALLQGNSLLRTIQNQLGSLLYSANPDSGRYRLASEAGLGFADGNEGLLELDREKLEDALSTDFESVVKVFVAATEDGITDGLAARMDAFVKNATDFASGLFRSGSDGIDARIKEIDGRIEREESRVSSYEEYLNRKFTAMEMMIAQLQSQGGFTRGF